MPEQDNSGQDVGCPQTEEDQLKNDVNAILDHVKLRDDRVPRRKGVGGCHDMNEFAKYNNEYEERSRTPHANVPGVFTVDYSLYELDRTGKPTGNLNTKVFAKTVYDPSIWTDDKLTNAAVQAALNAKANGTFYREWVGTTNEGYRIRGYQQGGKIQSFFFD